MPYYEMACRNFLFLSEPSESLKCSICLEVAREPRQEEICGKLFCRECIEKNGSGPCPTCRAVQPKFFNDKRSENSFKTF